MATLELNQLGKTYYKNKQPIQAVKSLNITCHDGEFIALLGPSGCGKSTTLRMIAGLEDITSGQIKIDDNVVNDLEPKDRGVGLAFENYALYPPLTVYENIAFNLKAKKMSKKEIDEEVMKISKLMHIEDLLDLKPAALSGGQKQRVNIARAIVRKPGVLLLDEPLSHLDGKMRQMMRTEIKRLQKEIGATTIIVTHDQSEALALADRIAIMNDGELQQYDTPHEVFHHPVNEFVAGFIGEPSMNFLTVKTIYRESGLYFEVVGAELSFPVPKINYSIQEGEKYRLGIRPTDVEIVSATDNYTFAARVTTYENLGEEIRVAIRISESFFNIVSFKIEDYKPNEQIYVYLKPEKINLFDIETGKRLNEK